ncbi:MAG: hypothetical protein LWW88_11750 [Acinetobacter sp.]|uniref:hypothetical protein n=1 Tax=Acinetobacter sp. TaxID=472 RepID=UPI002589AA59|nr:hypothetical protein [Acinetobacter sp.]MCE1272209.1 hypothetical protein [Acinetobacter sp.]
MSQQELVRFPARLQPNIHENLVAYAQQEGCSINTAVNLLLRFALDFGLKGKNEDLDEYLPDQKDNLNKINNIIDKFLLEVTVDEFARNNSQLYLKFIETQFENLKDEDRKVLSDVAYALANKEK